MKKIYLLLILTLASLCILSACMPEEDEPLDPPVIRAAEFERPPTALVARGDLVNIVRVSCNYKPVSERSYSFRAGGYFIDDIFVGFGDEVEEGQLLAALDRSDLIEAIEDARLDLRLAELNSRRGGNAGIGARQAEIAGLKLDELLEREAQRLIYAENSGRITYIRSYDADSRSNPIETVLTVSDRSVAAYSVSSLNGELIQAGNEYYVNIGGVEYRTLAETDENGSVVLYPDIPISDAAPYAFIAIETDKRVNALFAPSRAIKIDANGYIVYTLNDAGLREPVEVEIGLFFGGRVEIISGLEEGDEIIVE